MWITSATVLTGTVVAWCFNLLNGLILGRPWPFNSFLFIPADRFADLTNIMAAQSTGHPYGSPLMVYFPFTNVVLWPFKQLSNQLNIFVLCALLLTVTLVLFLRSAQFGSAAERLVVVQILLCSYPVVFAADRANVEILAYVMLAGFGWQWFQGRRGLATVLLSGAIATKGTAAIFLSLLWPKRHRQHLLACIGLVAVETLAGLFILKSSVLTSAGDFMSNLTFYNRTYAVGDSGYLFGHSMFGAAKGFITLTLGDESRRSFSSATFKGFAIAGLLAYAVAMVYVLRKSLALWAAMTILTCVSLLFTPVSNDYRLLLLLLPCALFFAHPEPVKHERLLGVLFGLALVPKGFHFILWSHSPSLAANLATVLGAVSIACLLAAVVRCCAHRGELPSKPALVGVTAESR